MNHGHFSGQGHGLWLSLLLLACCCRLAAGEPIRFPPLWQVQAVDVEESWQWEGTVQAGLDTALNEAGRCLEAQGWSYAYTVDISARPVVRLAVWQRGGSEFMLLLKEQASARWEFSAGIKEKKGVPDDKKVDDCF